MSIDLCRWRLEKAERTFKEGEQLLDVGFYNGAINRFYYAAFHAVRALLALKKLDSAKHSGVISLFNREYVKTGVISKEASKTLSTIFAMRSEADYDDFKSFSLQEAADARKAVRSLIDEVSAYLAGIS
ncbi:HEPN domain-containing protein [Neomoorella thermoacetica]|uniref:HEPN domain protein n=2 Tax=Neomoorella thermoacetica TaxID=1525 RepID=A0AAC9MU32_NEOTH|nr:HEPN domain-containing protein [Moorella thermoacetica]AKX94349.1 HEPN domain protein [Moorella thermoacetica]AKX96987.1 HEPN domain protein [Moorella thermoacetica]AOQ24298.1 HEPN domain protein [Moorella thermoacetica]OIQ54462.1 HEPN domain protein [Moorella thermoacetica]OIQ58158.1 HEPN domain protein [Moorella thermoacetica]